MPSAANTRQHPAVPGFTFSENANQNHDMQLVYSVRPAGAATDWADCNPQNEAQGSGRSSSRDEPFQQPATFQPQFMYSFTLSCFQPDFVGSFQGGTFNGLFKTSFNAWPGENGPAEQGRSRSQNRNGTTGNVPTNSASPGPGDSQFVSNHQHI